MASYQSSEFSKCDIIVHEDPNEVANVKPSNCPLCNSVVWFYQIHRDETFLMCGNTDCSYPIGITDCHVYKLECNEEIIKDARNTLSCSSSTSGSTLSCADWSELNKSLRNGCMLSPPVTLPPTLAHDPSEMANLNRQKELAKHEATLKQSVDEIKELNKRLATPSDDSIHSYKWIQQLAQMEQRSGLRLLREDELSRLKMMSKVPTINTGDVKLNIDSSGAVVSLNVLLEPQNGVLNDKGKK